MLPEELPVSEKDDHPGSLMPESRRFLESVLLELRKNPDADPDLIQLIERTLSGEVHPKPLTEFE